MRPEHTCDKFVAGHEHLAELGLIRMNGRIYDPVIGRFLQADPMIQAPQNAQSHNRYSYVMNNPLSFTDPSGFSSWTRFRDKWLKPIIAIGVAWALGPAGFFASQGGIFGAITGGMSVGVIAPSVLSTTQFISSVMAGFAAGGISGGNIQSALQGAFSAGLFFGAGSLADAAQGSRFSGFAEGGAGRVALHAAAGCASGAAAGGSCGRGAASAGFAEAVGGNIKVGGGVAGQVAFRAVIGGVASMIGGGKFGNGAMTGAFGYLFNCLAHTGCGSSPEERGAPEGYAVEEPKNFRESMEFFGKAGLVAAGSIGLPILGAAAFEAVSVNWATSSMVARYAANDVHHIFGRGGEAAASLIAQYGSREAALFALQRAAQGVATSAYQTGTWVTVTVGQLPVSIKGNVMDGVFRISTIAKRAFTQ
jgi:RHS repeat-associated protein